MNSRIFTMRIGIALLLTALLTCCATFAKVIYVDDDATSGGDGTSWAKAFTYLQDGVAKAASGDELHVAQGQYRPDRDANHSQGTGDRNAAFRLQAGISVMGGYAGAGAENPDERDVTAYETILSGDLVGDDDADFANYGDNSYHVVIGPGLLSGVTITAGYANGTDSNKTNRGGGVWFKSGAVTLENCTLELNQATYVGGAVYGEFASGNLALRGCRVRDNRSVGQGAGIAKGSGYITASECAFERNQAVHGAAIWSDWSVECTNCQFTENTATKNGAAIYATSGGASLTDCLFERNEAEQGGGLYGYGLSSGKLVVTRCTFSDNTAVQSGGGIALERTKTADFTDCRFEGNFATSGGGAYASGSDDLDLTRCAFIRNEVIDYGGGLAAYSNGARPMLRDCFFAANFADSGGGVFAHCTDISLINCLLVNNEAGFEGGAFGSSAEYCGGADARFVNCTFTGNVAPRARAIVTDVDSTSVVELANCILWDGGNELLARDGATLVVEHCDVQGGFPGTHNFNRDPAFVSPAGPDGDPATWEDNDHHLSDESSCIDRGGNDVADLPDSDFDGASRIQSCLIDIGVYESAFAIDCNANSEPDGCEITSGTAADCNKNGRIDGCDIADQLSPDLDGNGVPDECEIAIRYVNRSASAGGNGLSWATAYRDLQDALTDARVFSGSLNEIWVAKGRYTPDAGTRIRSMSFQLLSGAAMFGGFSGNETDRDQRDWAANPTILSGDLKGDDLGGFAKRADNSYHVIIASNTDDTARLDGFQIRGGWADGSNGTGAGVYNRSGSAAFANCLFQDNCCPDTFDGEGVAVYNWGGSPAFRGCAFTQNKSTASDSAVYSFEATPTFADCVFKGYYGIVTRAMKNYRSNAVITNCAFRSNVSGAGAAMYNDDSLVTVSGCMFESNQSGDDGGAIYNGNGSGGSFTNCTMKQNEADSNGGAVYNDSNYGASSPTFENCTFDANVAGSNGGAVFNESKCTPVFAACLFLNNRTLGYDGGAVYGTYASDFVFHSCMFDGNSANQDGGALLVPGYSTVVGHPFIQACAFKNNSAKGRGGAIATAANQKGDVDLMIADSLFFKNTATQYGGAISNYAYDADARLVLLNCTFASNTAPAGTALDCRSYDNKYPSSLVRVHNSVVWNGSKGLSNLDRSKLVVSYSDVYGSWEGIGNINKNPRFLDAATGDLHLLSDSPCIDAADNTVPIRDRFDVDLDGCVTEPSPADLDGYVRYIDDPDVQDTGLGAAPIIDMGAYEYGAQGPPTEGGRCAGDTDCSGQVDFEDIDAFVAALISRHVYDIQYPDCDFFSADCDNNGRVDFGDIDFFVGLLL